MSISRSMLLRLLLPLALAVLGTGCCALLIPSELRSIEEQLTGFPDSDVAAHLARPYVLGGLCFLPTLAALIYAFGGTLDRYLARQFAGIFFICVASLVLIWSLIDLADNLGDFRKSSNTFVTAANFYRFRAPVIVLLLLPYALLLSLIHALGKLSRNREMVAMVQSGRSLIRLTTPLIAAGVWCSLLCLGLNYHWAPTAEGRQAEILDAARGVLITEAKHVLYHNADNHRLWMIGAFPKHYEKGEALLNVEVTTTRHDGSLASRLTAKRASWDRHDSSWTFEAPIIGYFHPGRAPEFEIPNPPILRHAWPETPWQLIKPGLAAPYLGIPDLNGWLRANATKQHTLPNKNAAAPYLTQWHYRWALPFTCLVTVLLAAPLSIHFSRRSRGGNIFLAVVLSALMVFTASICLNFGEAGLLHPALAAWMPNLVFSLLGLYLFHRRIAGRPIYQSVLRLFSIIK
ncbi:MAG: LptF/LptG family permease [Verrucomicrobia bacterium]|nr:LptF/LptG family permease [Verrucomicrobiota bacterium]